uniref:GSVIVT01026467001 n=1 Tax=Arundo donax TaxID=35708 RepID=A0A0A9EME1_ARUDO
MLVFSIAPLLPWVITKKHIQNQTKECLQ